MRLFLVGKEDFSRFLSFDSKHGSMLISGESNKVRSLVRTKKIYEYGNSRNWFMSKMEKIEVLLQTTYFFCLNIQEIISRSKKDFARFVCF